MTPDDMRAEVVALRAELDAYRALPLVPGRDHERVCEQRDHYALELDRAIDDLANLEARLAGFDAMRDALADVMRVLGRSAGGPDEAAVFAHARGLLAESGVVPPAVEELRRAHEEWERRDGNP